MSKKYPGGIIRGTPVVPSGPFENSTAPGIWTLDQATNYIRQGIWPTAGNVQPDPFFENVTMLLHGDGTNGGQNNTFLDSSTNNFTITRNGNTTQGSFSPYGTLWSNYFINNYITTASTLGSFASNLTIECWVYSTVNGPVPWCLGDYSLPSGLIIQLFENGVSIQTDAVTLGAFSTTAWRRNTWAHVALVRNSGSITVYVNGVSVGSVASSATFSGSMVIAGLNYAGSINNGGTQYISNLRVTNTAAYTSNFTPSTTPLTAISGTQLLTCQSNRFVDNSSSARSLTVVGSDTSVQRFSPFAPTAAYSTATIGGSGYFDGEGDWLAIADAAALEPGSSSFTAEAWVYATAATAGTIFGKWNSNDPAERTFSVILESNGRVTAYWSIGNSFTSIITPSTNAIALNTWGHVALVRNGSTFTVYINGVSSATSTTSAALDNRAIPYTIGATSIGTFPLAGYISGHRYVVGTAVYTSNFTPPTAPPSAVTNTQLLTNFTNGAIFDNAMMNDLETVGNAQISTSVVKYGTGSLAFDGSGDSLNGIAASPNFQFGTGDFTVEMWVYTSNLSNYQTLLDTRSADTQSAWCLFLDNTGKPYWYDASGVQLSSTAVVSNTWTHLAVSRSGSTLRMFLSGVQVFSGTNSNAQNPTGTFYVGRNAVNAFLYTGYIDDLRITKGVARYTANFTPPTAAFPDI